MPRPRNVIVIVADSLRYDSVYSGPVGMPYAEANAIQFSQARSAGCWTLPATASVFTGLMPHEHGATSQTRGIHAHVPTLAERMRQAGYATYQVTANVATTHIFGLDRGFDEVRRIWKRVPARHKKIHQALVLVGKPRLRRQVLSKDFVAGKLSEDLDAAKVWLQSTCDEVFASAREILATNEKRGKGSFVFLNLMESHFPYHMAPTFQTVSDGITGQIRELVSLFHLVNQTWLTTGRDHIGPDMLQILRQRQRRAWEYLAPRIDAFLAELHRDRDNLVIFLADHGDNFGEQGWLYHFSNVTDAGNRVPLFWLGHDHPPRGRVDTPVSTRDLYGAILSAVGRPDARNLLLTDPTESTPIMQSYWYNNQGKTLPQYRFNQFCVLTGGQRYLYRKGRWYMARPQTDGPEPIFKPVPRGVNPIHDAVQQPERRRRILQYVEAFNRFSEQIGC